ncbi:hypothetical protein PCANB_002815 [Pneumocystis canis]|nr:hypothetical protein PCANB_002815 [Pneumocystis canis]
MTPTSQVTQKRGTLFQPLSRQQKQKGIKKELDLPSSRLTDGYRDRAKERQSQESLDFKAYALQEEMLLNLKEAVKKGEISHNDYVSQTQRLGGDFEHAGLVRGLDRVLLEKVKRGETIEVFDHKTETKSPFQNENEALDLDEIYTSNLSKKQDQKEDILKKKSYEELFPAPKTRKPETLSKFKPIGISKTNTIAKEIVDDQHLEKKHLKQNQNIKHETKSPLKATITTPKDCISEEMPKELLSEEPKEDVIFDDVGVYDLFESLNSHTNTKLEKQFNLKEASSTYKKMGGYFHTSTKEEEGFGLVDAGSLTKEAILHDDAQFVEVLKKAETLVQKNECKEAIHPKKKPTNMGFGLWLGEAYDDLDIHDEPLDDDDDLPIKSKKRVKGHHMEETMLINGKLSSMTEQNPVNLPTEDSTTFDIHQDAYKINTASSGNHIIRRKLTGYVGFANLPNQWYRKSIKKGFTFNVMVVGESGLGKSTLVNTLFNCTLYPPKSFKSLTKDPEKTIEIKSVTSEIEENGVKLKLTIVDTPGFGDFVNNEDSWQPILENIEQRFDAYLEAENRVSRANIVDNRIHACIFFIDPTGHSLKPLEIEFMKRLHERVNLIPVIAKSDTLTEQEILDDIIFHEINIFRPPIYEYDDEETVNENNEIVSKIPFAIVGSNYEVTTASGHTVRGRKYPWGVIEVENENHSDFMKLRQMLIRTHMEDLKEYTNDVLYENYRTNKLIQMGITQDSSVFKEVKYQEEERQLHEAKLLKMETEMKLVFQQKVQEKENKLKQSEEELYARHREMRDALQQQRLELEEKKSRLESGRFLEEKGKRKGFGLGR